MDDLKLKIEVDAGVSGKANVDAMGRAVEDVGGAAKKAQTSAERLDSAFDKLDIRSAKKIEADILGVQQALLKLSRDSSLSGAEIDRAFAAGQAQIRKFREELNGATGSVESAAKRTDGLIATLGKLGLAYSGVELARQFLTVNVQLESMQRTFLAITGSSKQAAEEMAYARDVADRLGLPLIAAGKAYADLAASTKGTRAEGQATRAVFEAVAQAMSVAGKSADDTQGALLALSQMASKGVVAMEELRGQLGERLPGALNAVASGFGITTAELIKLVEAGQVTAEQLFPALAQGLDKLYGSTSAAGEQAETLTQKWEHLKNAIADSFATVGDAGVVDTLKASLEGLEAFVVSASVGFVALGKTIGVFFAALKNGDIGLSGFSKNAKEAFAEIEKEARDKMLSAAAHNRVLAGGFSETERAAYKAAQATSKMGANVAEVGAGAANAGAAITRLNVTYNALEEAGKKATEQAKASAEARQAESAASENLAKALGTERQQLLAKQEATRSDAEALRNLADQRRADLTLTERHLAGIRAEVATRGKATEAEQKQIDALKELVDARRAEADAARGRALSAAVAAAEAEKEAIAYADNSLRVGELAAAYAAAQTALAALLADQAAGIDVSDALDTAVIAEAEAAAIYRDALNDQSAAIQRNAALKQAEISIEQAGIRLAVEQQRTILEVARARGDERGALQALLEMKRLEIKLAELTARAKNAEADAALAAVQAKREELQAAGELTVAKEAELKAQEAGAQVKKVEAEIAAESAKRLRELADATAEAGNQAGRMGESFRRSSGDLDTFGNSAERATGKVRALKDAADRPSRGLSGTFDGQVQRPGGGVSGNISLRPNDDELTVQQLKDKNYTAKEIEDYYGNRRLSEADKAAGLVSRNVSTQSIDHEQIGRSLGLSGPAVKAFSGLFGEALQEEMAALKQKLLAVNVTSTEGYLTEYSGAFERAKRRAADEARSAVAGDGIPSAPASVHRVELVINGKTTAIDTASPDSAASLINALKELKGRAA